MFSTLAASRHSVRAFKPDPVPSDVLDAILADASAAPSWSNTRPFALALATGERADRLRAAYTEEFDRTLDVQHRKPLAAAKLVLSGHAPDGDYKVWKPYPDDLRPHQVEVARLLYGAYGWSATTTRAGTAPTGAMRPPSTPPSSVSPSSTRA